MNKESRVYYGLDFLRLDDLPNTFLISLEPSFRRSFFELLIAEKGYKLLSKELGISVSFLYHLKNGRHAIRLKHLQILCSLYSIPINNLEKHISEIISNRGGRINFSFPIVPTNELASLLGHCFGDSSIDNKKMEFNYVNKDLSLVLSVISDVSKQFSPKTHNLYKQKDCTYKVSFSNLVGKILFLFGAPKGNKIDCKNPIPSWIMSGVPEIKLAFLKSLFDDDGSVLFSKKYPAINVNLHLTKLSIHEMDLRSFLQQVQVLLSDFSITSNGPYIARRYCVDGKERTVLGIFISDFENIKKFDQIVGFSHKEKKSRLKKCLLNRKRVFKSKEKKY